MKEYIHTKTLKVRIRDKHVKTLNAWAYSVNQVWNYCNELSYRSIRERQQWLSGYDLQNCWQRAWLKQRNLADDRP